jgi:hypothetical protein
MSATEQLAARFEKQISILRQLGFQGEVLVKAGLVIIGAFDKNSAAMIRKAFKKARNASDGALTEVRSETGAAFVWVSNENAMSKAEVRELAIAA